MRDADLFDDVVARLWRVRERLGSRVFRAAAEGALNGMAAAILEEAERRAGLRAPDGIVVRLPLGVARRRREHRET
ncbi:hypothetical protein [Methylosinus sp. RM1]|uniref:hypothetical protein n=1 Tax=Methylosinus sp. RM1 TaxID=2583817 RepID=UPI00140E7B0E|nr:hypothetical protein [Methylosinus sp. RM1]